MLQWSVLAIQVGHCESDLNVKCEVGLILIFSAQRVAVVNEVTYPVVYAFPMIGLSSARNAVVLVNQVGHCESDLIVKCEVGLILIFSAQRVAVASEVTYPVVYAFLRRGLSSAKAGVVLAIQVGHCETDLIVKCEVGFILLFGAQ